MIDKKSFKSVRASDLASLFSVFVTSKRIYSKKHPLLFSSISPRKMIRFVQKF